MGSGVDFSASYVSKSGGHATLPNHSSDGHIRERRRRNCHLPRQRLVDRDSGSAMAITPWEDEQGLAASDERANQVRSDVANEMQASSPRPLSAMG